MGEAWRGAVAGFLAGPPLLRAVPQAALRRLEALARALEGRPELAAWLLLLDFPLVRLQRRIAAVLVGPHGVVVLGFHAGAAAPSRAAREGLEDHALDLRDFHAGCRACPVVPVLVALDVKVAPATLPMLLADVAPVMAVGAAELGEVLSLLARSLPREAALDVAAWPSAPYRPVPTMIEAARMLYARHGVVELVAARADAASLGRTAAAVGAAIAGAEAAGERRVVFVTGIPGSGKTLCGLNAVFGRQGGAGSIFLTGNPTLVHVLREALARDAAEASLARGALRLARQRMESRIQALPAFRDHHVAREETPGEHVAVIDEAQRCWSADHARARTLRRPVALWQSEPGHLLDIMARPPGWSVVVCLIGNGQEIHTGEGGLAAWGEALAARPEWRSDAPPQALRAAEPLQRLPPLPGLHAAPALHLDVPVRSIGGAAAAEWVEAVLAGDAARALALAKDAGGVPFFLTREVAGMRRFLRGVARGTRRVGLVASSGAARLRAEGLGVELAHMDADAVAHWFLSRWPPDIRASDALETVATEFGCQGLELDGVGLCWGGDFIRAPGRADGWLARRFQGMAWGVLRRAEAVTWRRNAYRVLLTRARHASCIFVPEGAAEDPTRDPAEMDGVTEFLLACGVGQA